VVGQRETELIERALIGFHDAFAELLGPLMNDAGRLAYGMLQDYYEAEDRVQEAAELAWKRLQSLKPGRSFRPWFLGIVANRCREARRSRWWSVMRPSESYQDIEEIPAPESDWVEAAELRRALATLPHDQRLAIVLYFYLDLPLEEVAATLGISIAGVRSRIERAKRRLRLALEAAR
jgi:RNA polymerase sigma factor (sigma-70 family)